MDNPKFAYWQVDIDTVIEVFELAKSHGKKQGDNCQEEFEEVLKKKKDKFKLLGTGSKDLDLLTGDLREQGKKVFNLNEWERRQKKEENEN